MITNKKFKDFFNKNIAAIYYSTSKMLAPAWGYKFYQHL